MMITEESIIDNDALLQPISDQYPCGETADEQILASLDGPVLDNDVVELVLQNLSNYIRHQKDLPESEVNEQKRNIDNYPKALETCLSKHFKELAKVRYYLMFVFLKYGLQGLRDGILFLEQLLDRHWSSVHPQNVEERVQFFSRQAPFFSGNTQSTEMLYLNRIPLDDVGEFRVLEIINAEDVSDQEMDAWIQRSHTTDPNGLFQSIVNCVDTILERTEAIGQSVRERLQADVQAAAGNIGVAPDPTDEEVAEGEVPAAPGPPPEELRFKFLQDNEVSTIELLDEDFSQRLNLFRKILIEKVKKVDPDFMEEKVDEPGPAGVAAGQIAGVAIGAINTRKEAIDQLGKIADFFKKNEPHSPISYALREVEKWGRLDYPELLKRLAETMVDDDSTFKGMFTRFGMNWDESE